MASRSRASPRAFQLLSLLLLALFALCAVARAAGPASPQEQSQGHGGEGLVPAAGDGPESGVAGTHSTAGSHNAACGRGGAGEVVACLLAPAAETDMAIARSLDISTVRGHLERRLSLLWLTAKRLFPSFVPGELELADWSRWQLPSLRATAWDMAKLAGEEHAKSEFWRDGSVRSLVRRKNGGNGDEAIETDPYTTDPGLLRKHSAFRSYTVTIPPGPSNPPHTAITYTYPSVRTFFTPHPHASKLPQTPTPIPLLVFVHGLGGSVAQFHPLLTSLTAIAPCLAIDLPGCGRSMFAPRDWAAYSTEALARLVGTAIAAHVGTGDDSSADHIDADNVHREKRRKAPQPIVLIGHSLGASIAALLASKSSPLAGDMFPPTSSVCVVGLVGICPRADPPGPDESVRLRRFLRALPGPLFDAFRWWDRRGGLQSKSVERFVGSKADREARKLQWRFNAQSKTSVWKKVARGAVPVYVYDDKGVRRPTQGLPGRDVWTGIEVPALLVAGEDDTVTGPGDVEKIKIYLGKGGGQTPSRLGGSEPLPAVAAPVDLSSKENLVRGTDVEDAVVKKIQADDVSSSGESEDVEATPPEEPAASKSRTTSGSDTLITDSPGRGAVLKITILPAPASHGLLYQPVQARTLSGLIQTFLERHVDARLALGWQLHHLSTEGKWDVKNLAKWRAVPPVSAPIAGLFRAMKTLREVDEVHAPKVFVKRWGWMAAEGRNGEGSRNNLDKSSGDAFAAAAAIAAPAPPPASSDTSKSPNASSVAALAAAAQDQQQPELPHSARDAVIAVIDISHEQPVYDPRGLEAGGVSYYKFPTVSKLPPSVEEVEEFVKLVDKLRGIEEEDETQESGDKGAAPMTELANDQGEAGTHESDKTVPRSAIPLPPRREGLIGVHCHYGFNRTGFFIVSYLVERLGYGLQEALDEFATMRPPGIRHEHFVDTLFVRYCVGLKRAPTL
ncbi:Alpha/Beta hydrolase protein [Lineolata rhizophorae]|uniref:Alpha/Beta hydrolase protein n=1 Tax=Lineolata rhizophorae TaxID=578093 RepID=A0A6A6P360_9PEZI|nr:Alpha/Beta hydrolase protein [Lineolata rhizophorae]